MIKKIRKVLAIMCICAMFCQTVHASDTDDKHCDQVQTVNDTEAAKDTEAVKIADEDIPLGLDSQAQFERYKKDVVVMILFGGMVVLITVVATIKEKYEREKYN